MFYLYKRRIHFNAKSIKIKTLSEQIENYIISFNQAVTFILIKQW